MKTKEISVTIRHTINVGNYESIGPSVTLSAELEEGDEVGQCYSLLHKEAQRAFAKQVLTEIGWVRRRRDNPEKFDSEMSSTRDQVKSLITG